MATKGFKSIITTCAAPEPAPSAAPTKEQRHALVFASLPGAAHMIEAGVYPPAPKEAVESMQEVAPPSGDTSSTPAAPSDDTASGMPSVPIEALPASPEKVRAAHKDETKAMPMEVSLEVHAAGDAPHPPATHEARQNGDSLGYFDIECAPRVDGVRAVLSLGKIHTQDQHHKMLVVLPKSLALALDRQVDGHKAPAITALLQWALQKLDEEQVTLTVRSRTR